MWAERRRPAIGHAVALSRLKKHQAPAGVNAWFMMMIMMSFLHDMSARRNNVIWRCRSTVWWKCECCMNKNRESNMLFANICLILQHIYLQMCGSHFCYFIMCSDDYLVQIPHGMRVKNCCFCCCCCCRNTSLLDENSCLKTQLKKSGRKIKVRFLIVSCYSLVNWTCIMFAIRLAAILIILLTTTTIWIIWNYDWITNVCIVPPQTFAVGPNRLVMYTNNNNVTNFTRICSINCIIAATII